MIFFVFGLAQKRARLLKVLRVSLGEYSAHFWAKDSCNVLPTWGRGDGRAVNALDSGVRGRGFESWLGHQNLGWVVWCGIVTAVTGGYCDRCPEGWAEVSNHCESKNSKFPSGFSIV